MASENEHTASYGWFQFFQWKKRTSTDKNIQNLDTLMTSKSSITNSDTLILVSETIQERMVPMTPCDIPTCSSIDCVIFEFVSCKVDWASATRSCKPRITCSFSASLCRSFPVSDSNFDMRVDMAMAVIRRATSSCSYGSEGRTANTSCDNSNSPPLPIFT